MRYGMLHGLVALALAGALSACGKGSRTGTEPVLPFPPPSTTADSGCTSNDCPPDGAVSTTKDHVWMVPVKNAPVECRAYTKWSRRYAVDNAIYYRTWNGGFTMDRSRSICRDNPDDSPLTPANLP